MENKRLEELLNCYLAGDISHDNEQELFALLGSEEYDAQVKTYMQQIWPKANSGHLLSDESSQKILSLIFSEQQTPVFPIRKSFGRRWIWAAAGILAITATFSIFNLMNNHAAKMHDVAAQKPVQKINDVAPGTNGAILKLADGTSIVLDSLTNGTVSTQGNMLVVKNGSSLNYLQNASASSAPGGYNTIETPNGRQFSLILGDGTKVWLNAASSIRFPVTFSGKDRPVDITGEAYFEVAKNKDMPFRVSVNGSTVEVLGTHFNINSYKDENTLNTTLLEGSVRISSGTSKEMLTPGQQAQVNLSGAISKVKNVNVDEVVAWKNNSFSFNNTDLKKLMRQVSRWYDVEIEYRNTAVDPVKFNGHISRNVTLSNVLKMLELTGEVNFTIEGKKIIVST